MEYLDGQFKKGENAQVKAGFQKSYKILRTLDDGGEWNLLILRENESLAAIETNVEKADALLQQIEGTDQWKRMRSSTFFPPDVFTRCVSRDTGFLTLAALATVLRGRLPLSANSICPASNDSTNP